MYHQVFSLRVIRGSKRHYVTWPTIIFPTPSPPPLLLAHCSTLPGAFPVFYMHQACSCSMVFSIPYSLCLENPFTMRLIPHHLQRLPHLFGEVSTTTSLSPPQYTLLFPFAALVFSIALTIVYLFTVFFF